MAQTAAFELALTHSILTTFSSVLSVLGGVCASTEYEAECIAKKQ